jgi:choline kinase
MPNAIVKSDMHSRVKISNIVQEIIQLRVGISKLKERVKLLESFLDDDSKGEYEEYVKSKNQSCMGGL